MATIALEMFAGDDESFDIGPVLDKDGAVIDITGLELRFAAALRRDAVALVEKTTEDGIDIPIGTDGLATVSLVPADTQALAIVLFWDLTITDDDDKVRTLASGTLLVKAKIGLGGS